jgi:hypothetical protein
MVGRIPDAEAMVVNYLNDNATIIGLLGEDKVSTELPAEAILPRIRVTLSGGQPVGRHWLKQVKFNIEAWAESKTEALEIIVEASYQLETGLDGAQLEQGIFTSFEQDTGISWSPDPITNTPRYILGFVAYMHENN